MNIDWEKLAAPFDPKEIEWRLAESGVRGDGQVWAKCVAYIDNRAIMNRLDEAVGPENWRNEFKTFEGGALCGISIRTDDGEWITKWDGAGNTNFEAIKGGLSGAMKRAAVQFGLGRYLYGLDVTWAEIVDKKDGGFYAKTKKEGKVFYWLPPKLPEWALPENLRFTKRANGAPPADETPEPPPSDHPANQASTYSKALAAIQNAPTLDRLRTLEKAMRQRIDQDEWTASEVKRLESEVEQRRIKLAPPRRWIVSNLKKLGCPESVIREWTDRASEHEDPAEFIKGKPWEPAEQKELIS